MRFTGLAMTDRLLSTRLLGFPLRNPIVAASGPSTQDFESIRRLSDAGIGAAITKTIVVEPSVNPRPCLHRGKGYFFNTERCSTLPLSRWLGEELPRLRELPIPVIASIGMTATDVAELARPVVEAGADMLELSIFTRYDDPEPMIDALDRVKQEVDVPILVKLSCNVHDVVAFGVVLRAHGAAGFSSIDALKAGMDIEVASGRPVLGEQGYGRISGEAIRTLALYHVAMLNHYIGLPVIGTGGILSGEDAVKMLSCGAQCVGVCTGLILGGPAAVPRLIAEMSEAIERCGKTSVDEVRGRTLSFIDFPGDEEARREYEHVVWRGPRGTAAIEHDRCVACGHCLQVCPHGAIRREDSAYAILPNDCEGCGLCVSLCPVSAIEWNRPAEETS